MNKSQNGTIIKREFNWTWEGKKAGTIISVSPAGSMDDKHFNIEIRAFTHLRKGKGTAI